MKFHVFSFCGILAIFLYAGILNGQDPDDIPATGPFMSFTHDNEKLIHKIFLKDGKIFLDSLIPKREWLEENGSQGFILVNNGGFAFDVMWTGWRAPGKINNADNRIALTQDDFVFTYLENEVKKEKTTLTLYFKGRNNPFHLRIFYSLETEDWYFRRKIAIRDTSQGLHFLHEARALDASLPRVLDRRTGESEIEILKEGGFGQPVALRYGSGGAFAGMEYPIAENTAGFDALKRIHITCSDLIGRKISTEWMETEPVVMGLSPDSRVKFWFMEYVERIRVHPAEPYTLYNSWYDLRSAEYPNVPESSHMNEANVMRMIGLVKENMTEKHGIHLDAFVLDDGWDIYKSDWKLRDVQFPGGLKPISDKLAETDTDLGIWFGPTGGYSKRTDRIHWMEEHGYEVTGEELRHHTAMLCLAGENYDSLFRKRVVDFVKDDGVGYFKWDGIQFSCSEEDHGHPVGIYSRKAIFESVADKCRAVREINPGVYLNITSGTWLSPWWVKYADQIWMDAMDYGYTDIPTIDKRDAAMSYRDNVLYVDFREKDLWFPMANLMTHGIIKGNLQKLGGEQEPTDKFTNNAMLYFSRGVTMWELYISPDLLGDDEWEAIAKSMQWAESKKEILENTFMVGGDPKNREAYGYVHFKGNRGVIAVRNPFVLPQILPVRLDPEHGFDSNADSIVVDKVFPSRWISTRFFKPGEALNIPLEGFETAVYGIYPVSDATVPLIAGVDFEVVESSQEKYSINYMHIVNRPVLLNPEMVQKVTGDGRELDKMAFPKWEDPPMILSQAGWNRQEGMQGTFGLTLSLGDVVTETELAFLLEPDPDYSDRKMPEIELTINGKQIESRQVSEKGKWIWYLADIEPGPEIRGTVKLMTEERDREWKGKISAWSRIIQQHQISEMTFTLTREPQTRPLPPRNSPVGRNYWWYRIGETDEVILN